MPRYRIKLTLLIEAVVEEQSPQAVATRIGEGLGECLADMGASEDGQAGMVMMRGEIEPVGGPSAPTTELQN